jgi:hypothetical protein
MHANTGAAIRLWVKAGTKTVARGVFDDDAPGYLRKEYWGLAATANEEHVVSFTYLVKTIFRQRNG